MLVINKIDSLSQEENIHEFFELGLGNPVPISAMHGRRVGDMLDCVLDKIGKIKNLDSKNVVSTNVDNTNDTNVNLYDMDKQLNHERIEHLSFDRQSYIQYLM